MKKITTSDLKKLPHRLQVTFALFCVNQIKHLWKDIPEAVEAVEVTKKWLAGKATKEECKKVARAAYAVAAANAAAYAVDAAYADNAVAAYDAVDAAAYAVAAYAADTANADAVTTIRKEQLTYYDNLLAMVDGRVDEILVGYKI